LQDVGEAVDYLRDSVLRARYEAIVEAMAQQLAGGTCLETLMGGSTDALKLASSLTLFRGAAQQLQQQDTSIEGLAQRWDGLLQQTAAQGYPPCAFTLSHLAGG
jgi:uncharacterized protein (DUF1810 family)